NEVFNEEKWRAKSSWTVDCAKSFHSVVAPIFPGMELNYVKSYVGLYVGNDMYFWFHKRGGNKALSSFWVREAELLEITAALDEKGLLYSSKNQRLRLTVDQKIIETNSELFKRIATLVKNAWRNS